MGTYEKEIGKSAHDLELRSEKVRSIIGQVPPSLLRYGALAILAALVILVYVSYSIPYKQIYTGTAVIRALPDSLEASPTAVLIKFSDRRPALSPTEKLPITLHTPMGEVEGKLVKLSSWRDSLGRQEAFWLFLLSELSLLQNHEVDFTIVRTSGNILQKVLGDLFWLSFNKCARLGSLLIRSISNSTRDRISCLTRL